jgi:hypothetical protein
MIKKINCFCLIFLVLFFTSSLLWASGLEVDVVSVSQGKGIPGSFKVTVKYKLTADEGSVSEDMPVYVFLTYTTNSDDKNVPWNRATQVEGDVGMITSTGDKTITWNWKSEGVNEGNIYDKAKVKVHAIEMVKVPKSNEGAYKDLEGFYLQKYPTTTKQYVDFLNAQANAHDPGKDAAKRYWHDEMSDDKYGHITMTGTIGKNAIWSVSSEFEDYPVVYVSWYNAYDYAKWAGLRLPTSKEFLKTAKGKKGDWKYYWGNEEPNPQLCNYNMNIKTTTDVNYYEYAIREHIKNRDGNLGNFYGAYDLAGNVWEWQDTYYADNTYVQLGGDFTSELALPIDKFNFTCTPSTFSFGTGFRCARDLESK